MKKWVFGLVFAAIASFSYAAEDYTSNFAALNTGLKNPTQQRLAPISGSKPPVALPGIPDGALQQPAIPKPKTPAAVAKKATPKPLAANPYDIPDSALNLIPGLKDRITLPGLGSTPGAPKLMGQNVVRIGDGRNEVIYVSFSQPNRISTPFVKPQAVHISEMQIQPIGQDLYMTPGKDSPVGLFISDESGGSRQVASLTLVPANIPGQNISLVFEAPKDLPENLLKEGKGSSHLDTVRSVLTNAINGEAPQGYEWSNVQVGVARIGNVLVTPKRLLSSVDTNVFIYELKNIGQKDVELTEQSFYEDGVQGVAFWPNLILRPGETSNVHIMSLKKAD